MPTFMDVHTVDGGVSANDVAAAHQADLTTQTKYGVNYKHYWSMRQPARSSAWLMLLMLRLRRPCTVKRMVW